MSDRIENLSDIELTKIIKEVGNYDDVAFALTELKKRKNNDYITYARDILNNSVGDELLQATAFELFYYGMPREAVKLLELRLNNIPVYVFTSALECFCEDGLDIIGSILSTNIIEKLLKKCESLKNDNREEILRSINWFIDSFGQAV